MPDWCFIAQVTNYVNCNLIFFSANNQARDKFIKRMNVKVTPLLMSSSYHQYVPFHKNQISQAISKQQTKEKYCEY